MTPQRPASSRNSPQQPSTAAVPDAWRSPSSLALLLSAWFAATILLTDYFYTVEGQGPLLRDSGLALMLLFTSLCWFRATRHSRVYLLVFAVLAVLVVLESFAFGYGPDGDLAAAWWNQKITGVLMLVSAATGWPHARAVESSLRENDENDESVRDDQPGSGAPRKQLRADRGPVQEEDLGSSSASRAMAQPTRRRPLRNR